MTEKKNLLAAVLALSIMLTGCVGNAGIPADTESESAGSILSEPETEETPPAQDNGAPDNALTFSAFSGGAQTADGFYAVHYYDDWTGCLVFYDYATRQAVPLCAQVNCEHHDDTCPAWFGDSGNIPRIVTNGQQLAYCYLSSPARVETAAIDGSGRKVLYEFAANESPYEKFCVDEEYLYTLVTRVTEGDNGSQTNSQELLRIQLEDGSSDSLWSADLPNGTFYFLSGCLDHRLVLKEIRTEEGDGDQPFASQTHSLMLVDPRDGSTAPLWNWQQGEALESPVSDTLYCITQDHRLCTLTAQGELLELAQDERFSPTLSQVQYADDDALWFTAPEGGEEGETCLYRLDLADGSIALVPLSRSCSLTVAGEYEDALFVRIMSDESIGAGQSTRYALVPKDALASAESEADLEVFSSSL